MKKEKETSKNETTNIVAKLVPIKNNRTYVGAKLIPASIMESHLWH